MKNSLINKWIIVGTIWFVALGLTCWNIIKIDSIIPAREREEIYQMDELFWKYNSGNISRILKEKARLFHSTESLKLGLIAAENQLREKSEKYRFKDFSVVNHPTRGDGEGMPVSLAYRGTFKGTIQWLDTLEKEFPFMPVQKITISTSPPVEEAKFQIFLIYRYTIVTSENTT
ncbi:MAG: hypothetical protein H8E17_00155 [Deltaproteobacteria bacterium]|nr:hypothetical protein [Deltaproteobacteria bacterium]